MALTSTSLSPLGMGAARGPARSDAGYTLDDLGWRDDQSEPQKLLKLLGAEAAPVSVSAEDRIRPQLRSQIALTCREHAHRLGKRVGAAVAHDRLASDLVTK